MGATTSRFRHTVLLFAGFLVILASGPGFQQAQVRDKDQTAVRPDSGQGALIIVPDSLKNSRRISGSGGVFSSDTLQKSPWGAVLRSLVVPGWGQWYNGRKWKAPLYLTSDAIMMGVYIQRDHRVVRLEKQRAIIDRQLKTDPFLTAEKRRILQARFDDLTGNLDAALNRRNLFGWLFAISHLLGMVDAYTDAHLYKFDEKIEMSLVPLDRGYSLSMIWLIR